MTPNGPLENHRAGGRRQGVIGGAMTFGEALVAAAGTFFTLTVGIVGWLITRAIGVVDSNVTRIDANVTKSHDKIEQLFLANSTQDTSIAECVLRLSAMEQEINRIRERLHKLQNIAAAVWPPPPPPPPEVKP